MDLDLRKLRYFVAVAQHRHVGRAAESLFIAQPVLSRQVRALERELGCSLLTTTTRSVQLTPAGEQLDLEARQMLAAVDAAVRRVHDVDRGRQRLVVAFTPGLHVADVVRSYASIQPLVEVDLLRLDWWAQDAPLRDGRADVGYLRRPFEESGLHVIRVGTDPRVVCLPTAHRLAQQRTVTEADLADEDMFDAQARRTSSIEEKLELITTGTGIALVPRSVARSYSRPDLVYRQVCDLTPAETCIVVREGHHESRVSDFVAIATSTLSNNAHRTAAADKRPPKD